MEDERQSCANCMFSYAAGAAWAKCNNKDLETFDPVTGYNRPNLREAQKTCEFKFWKENLILIEPPTGPTLANRLLWAIVGRWIK